MLNTNLLNMAAQFKANPMQMLSRRYNLPQNVNNPQDIVQYLLNTGQVSQSQVNSAMQMRNNPSLRNILGNRS